VKPIPELPSDEHALELAPALAPWTEDSRATDKRLIFVQEGFDTDLGVVTIAQGRVAERHFKAY
jgi:hypothetical protein